MVAPHRRWAAELLHFWFQKLGPRDWFRGEQHVDAALRKRFERELTMLRTRMPGEFLTNPRTAQAAVLLFDQVPRNIYRGQRCSFAFDPLARSVARGALKRGYDKQLDMAERQFLAMPLMHSEHISDQLESLAFYRSLPHHGWSYARSHCRMIARFGRFGRFGRFPHRNKTLGRKSSAIEIAAVEAGNHW